MKTTFNFTIEALALTLIVTIKVILWTRDEDEQNVFTFKLTDYAGNEISTEDEVIFSDCEVRDELDQAIKDHIDFAIYEDARANNGSTALQDFFDDDEIERITYNTLPDGHISRVVELRNDDEFERELAKLAEDIENHYSDLCSLESELDESDDDLNLARKAIKGTPGFEIPRQDQESAYYDALADMIDNGRGELAADYSLQKWNF